MTERPGRDATGPFFSGGLRLSYPNTASALLNGSFWASATAL